MANTDKNILITPNIGSTTDDPKIVFSGADSSTTAQNITLYTYPESGGTLSLEGSEGQLFSITNDFTGTIFSVNDVSGIPSIEVEDDGMVKFAEYAGNVLIGTDSDDGSNKLQVNGNIYSSGNITAADLAMTGDLTISGTVDGRDVASDGSKLDGIAASANNYSHPTSAGNKHIPTGGSAGQFLKYSASGTAVWASDNNTWRGIQDNLTSTTTTESLSANQGRLLKNKTHKQTSQSNSGTVTINLDSSNNHNITLTGNSTLSLSNIANNVGVSGNIILQQDATGGRTVTLSSEMKTPLGGASIDFETGANSISALSYYVVSSTVVLVNYIGNFA